MTGFSNRSLSAAMRRRRVALVLSQEQAHAAVSAPLHFEVIGDTESLPPSMMPVDDSDPQRAARRPATNPAEFQQLLQQSPSLTWVFAGDSLSSRETATRAGNRGSHVSSLVCKLRDQQQRTADAFVTLEQPGCRLRDLCGEAEERIARFAPDVLCISFGSNELSDLEHSTIEFEQQLQRFLRQYLDCGVTLIVGTPLFDRSLKGDSAVDRLVRLEAIRGSVKECSALLVDHWAHWEEKAAPDWYLDGGTSPSVRGASEMSLLTLAEMGLEPDILSPESNIVLAEDVTRK